jgi:hypothetical protein
MTELEEILNALKVKTSKEALQKIEMFIEWNKQDVRVIEQLKKEIKSFKNVGLKPTI